MQHSSHHSIVVRQTLASVLLLIALLGTLLTSASIASAQALGIYSGVTCTINAIPVESAAPSAAIKLVFNSTDSGSVIIFDNKEYLAGQSTTVNPLITTTYKAYIKYSTVFCTNTVPVPSVPQTTTTSTGSTTSTNTTSTASTTAGTGNVCAVYGEYKEGNEGIAVTYIQTFLSEQGYAVAIDGKYNSATTAAIKLFQAANASEILAPQGLTTATGIWELYTAIKARSMRGCGINKPQATTTTTTTATVPQATTTTTSVSAATSAANVTATATSQTVCVSDRLEQGNSGPEVRAMQQFLISKGFMTVAANGYFGPSTKRAVAAFQTKYASDILYPSGFTTATGIWAYNTAKKASELGLCSFDTEENDATPVVVGTTGTLQSYEPVTSSTVCLSEVIAPETTSNKVKQIQRWLRSQGYTDVNYSGYFGPVTKAALESFQQTYASEILTPGGYTKPTGMWGPRTAAKASELGLCDYVK
jgi:peptidoglycan hydrolase-like protein with peptidoglycan-binding domain